MVLKNAAIQLLVLLLQFRNGTSLGDVIIVYPKTLSSQNMSLHATPSSMTAGVTETLQLNCSMEERVDYDGRGVYHAVPFTCTGTDNHKTAQVKSITLYKVIGSKNNTRLQKLAVLNRVSATNTSVQVIHKLGANISGHPIYGQKPNLWFSGDSMTSYKTVSMKLTTLSFTWHHPRQQVPGRYRCTVVMSRTMTSGDIPTILTSPKISNLADVIFHKDVVVQDHHRAPTVG